MAAIMPYPPAGVYKPADGGPPMAPPLQGIYTNQFGASSVAMTELVDFAQPVEEPTFGQAIAEAAEILWRGSIATNCCECIPCLCCCPAAEYELTSKSIEITQNGCCSKSSDTIDMSNPSNVKFDSSCCTSTVTFTSAGRGQRIEGCCEGSAVQGLYNALKSLVG